MFKEIEKELLSIISDDPIEKIAHTPTIEIAKTMELIYSIKFEDIKRVYTKKFDSDIINMTVIHDNKDKKSISSDLCPINGKVYHIIFIHESLLNKDENNAIVLCRTILVYISYKISLILNKYTIFIKNNNDILFLTTLQAPPIIMCAILRKIYSGPTLSKLIYMTLCEHMETYKTLYTEEGVNTILNLFDEGLGVSELLDSGFICSIPVADTKYPGIWCNLLGEDES